MKQSLVFAFSFVVIIGFITSCDKKNYICNCTTTDSLGASTSTYTSIYGKKEAAKTECEKLSKVYNGKTTVCGL
jgi:hypothetical protein